MKYPTNMDLNGKKNNGKHILWHHLVGSSKFKCLSGFYLRAIASPVNSTQFKNSWKQLKQIVPEFLSYSPYFQIIIRLAGFRKCLGTRFRKRLISSQRNSINQSINQSINKSNKRFCFSYKLDLWYWLIINVNRYLWDLFFESWM